MKKILVTGAGGFVGSRVMQQWAGHYELCTLSLIHISEPTRH